VECEGTHGLGQKLWSLRLLSGSSMPVGLALHTKAPRSSVRAADTGEGAPLAREQLRCHKRRIRQCGDRLAAAGWPRPRRIPAAQICSLYFSRSLAKGVSRGSPEVVTPASAAAVRELPLAGYSSLLGVCAQRSESYTSAECSSFSRLLTLCLSVLLHGTCLRHSCPTSRADRHQAVFYHSIKLSLFPERSV
jgi:hypothetical protein